MALQLRGIPDRTAFTGGLSQTPNHLNGYSQPTYRGLFYVEYGRPPELAAAKAASIHQVLCLDVRLSNGDAIPFGRVLAFRGDTDVVDFEGPLDLRLRVKGYSPKRSAGQAPSQVLVLGDRDRKLDRGPRVIRVRDEDHP